MHILAGLAVSLENPLVATLRSSRSGNGANPAPAVSSRIPANVLERSRKSSSHAAAIVASASGGQPLRHQRISHEEVEVPTRGSNLTASPGPRHGLAV
jgi:hypothetical protein